MSNINVKGHYRVRNSKSSTKLNVDKSHSILFRSNFYGDVTINSTNNSQPICVLPFQLDHSNFELKDGKLIAASGNRKVTFENNALIVYYHNTAHSKETRYLNFKNGKLVKSLEIPNAALLHQDRLRDFADNKANIGYNPSNSLARTTMMMFHAQRQTEYTGGPGMYKDEAQHSFTGFDSVNMIVKPRVNTIKNGEIKLFQHAFYSDYSTTETKSLQNIIDSQYKQTEKINQANGLKQVKKDLSTIDIYDHIRIAESTKQHTTLNIHGNQNIIFKTNFKGNIKLKNASKDNNVVCLLPFEINPGNIIKLSNKIIYRDTEKTIELPKNACVIYFKENQVNFFHLKNGELGINFATPFATFMAKSSIKKFADHGRHFIGFDPSHSFNVTNIPVFNNKNQSFYEGGSAILYGDRTHDTYGQDMLSMFFIPKTKIENGLKRLEKNQRIGSKNKLELENHILTNYRTILELSSANHIDDAIGQINPKFNKVIRAMISDTFLSNKNFIQVKKPNSFTYGTSNDDKIMGSRENDTITGGKGDDFFFSNTGRNTLFGNEGDDVFALGGGINIINGGSGTDLVYLESNSKGAKINLSPKKSAFNLKSDVLINIEMVLGSTKDDNITGCDKDNYVSGKEGNDLIKGQAGNDALFGCSGRDRIYGGQGNDHISGGENHDILYGGQNNDTLLGNEGDDILDGGPGADTMFGGDGWDLVSYKNSKEGVELDFKNTNFYGGDATGDIIVYDIEACQASSHDDIVKSPEGRKNAFELKTGSGNDKFFSFKNQNEVTLEFDNNKFETKTLLLTKGKTDLVISSPRGKQKSRDNIIIAGNKVGKLSFNLSSKTIDLKDGWTEITHLGHVYNVFKTNQSLNSDLSHEKLTTSTILFDNNATASDNMGIFSSGKMLSLQPMSGTQKAMIDLRSGETSQFGEKSKFFTSFSMGHKVLTSMMSPTTVILNGLDNIVNTGSENDTVVMNAYQMDYFTDLAKPKATFESQINDKKHKGWGQNNMYCSAGGVNRFVLENDIIQNPVSFKSFGNMMTVSQGYKDGENSFECKLQILNYQKGKCVFLVKASDTAAELKIKEQYAEQVALAKSLVQSGKIQPDLTKVKEGSWLSNRMSDYATKTKSLNSGENSYSSRFVALAF